MGSFGYNSQQDQCHARGCWTVVAFELAAAGIYAGADRDHSRFVVPNVPDLTIKTRETIDLPQSTVQIKTLYFKGAWQRRDLYLRFPSALPAQRTMRHTTITRCDERRTLELSHEARLYAWSPLNFIGSDVYRVRSRWRERPEPPAAGADVKITINSVDTSERRQVGSRLGPSLRWRNRVRPRGHGHRVPRRANPRTVLRRRAQRSSRACRRCLGRVRPHR